MNKYNIISVLLIFLVFCIFVACSGAAEYKGMQVGNENDNEFEGGDIVEFDYLVPDYLITDDNEKNEMIRAKINHLRVNNYYFWGELPGNKDEILGIYKEISGFISKKFPAFIGLEIDWYDFVSKYYNEMGWAENYGEFAYILTYMGYKLKEGHTLIQPSRLVNDNEVHILDNHAPVFITQPYSRIDACYTVTEKEELVISKLFPYSSNPYNFKIGDEIVGFNGISWSEWIDFLIECGIPIYDSPGATESSIRYNLLKAGMANVNLFEKINIRRIDTGEIETMDIVYIDPSEGLANCTDLTQAEGLSSWKKDNLVYGKLEGTNIGYIYIRKCEDGFDEFPAGLWDPYETEFSKEFEKAVLELIETDGLIIDLRSNSGGRPEPLFKGLSHLIKSDSDEYLFGVVQRDEESNDVTKLKNVPGYPWVPLKADEPDLHYNNPIIVMTGPDCISACDMLVALMSKYEEFTIIGKDTNGSAIEIDSMNGRTFPISESYEDEYVKAFLTTRTFYFRDDPENYLIRRDDFVDKKIWFTKEDITNEIDTVREYAVKLINEN